MFRRSRSVAEAQAASGPAAPGFDLLRLGLALYVYLWHCFTISSADGMAAWVWNGWFGPVQRSALPMFFALSGFLVAGSFSRNRLVDFVALRALRIVPALAFEVALSAILLGSLFTTLPLREYWSSPRFWSYFLNIVGDIHFELPGVFGGAGVNVQLWTLPLELQCYLSMIVLGLCGGARRRLWLLAVGAILCVAITLLAVRYDLIQPGPGAPRPVFVLSFLFGVALHLYREVVPLRFDLFVASLAATYLSSYFPDYALIAPAPIAYATVYIGLARAPRLPFGDISYGIYLFHYPLLAAVYEMLGHGAHWLALFALGLAPTLIFATLSWLCVEKPVLQRKRLALAACNRLEQAAVPILRALLSKSVPSAWRRKAGSSVVKEGRGGVAVSG